MDTQRHNAVQGRVKGEGLRHILLMAGFTVLAACAMAEARPVTCESTGGTQFCPADTRGGVRLIGYSGENGQWNCRESGRRSAVKTATIPVKTAGV